MTNAPSATPSPRVSRAAVAGEQFVDCANQLNRDVFAMWTSAVETGLQATFEAQNTALASGQAWTETTTKLSTDALGRWAAVARQAQATTLKAYQSSTRLLDTLTPA